MDRKKHHQALKRRMYSALISLFKDVREFRKWIPSRRSVGDSYTQVYNPQQRRRLSNYQGGVLRFFMSYISHY